MRVATGKVLNHFAMFSDLLICALSLLAASTILYHRAWVGDTLLVRYPLRQALVALALAFSWHVSLVSNGAYRVHLAVDWWRQTIAIARGATLVAFCTFVYFCFVRSGTLIASYSLLREVLCFWAFVFGGLLATRGAIRFSTRFLPRRSRHLRSVLVLGTNRRAVALADRLLTNTDPGYRLAGFVDDLWHFEGAPEKYKASLLGGSGEVRGFLGSLAIDEVIIALPMASFYHLIHQVIGLCHEQGILVRLEGSLFEVLHRDRLDNALADANAATQFITILEGNRSEWSLAGKRLIDLLLSTAALCASLPFMAIIALSIKVTSPGPVFFSQERVGMGKRRFRVLKFRTMVVDAEALMAKIEHLNQQQGPTFKVKHDPRVTRLGSFLRKTSLDELPQLLNVFAGDMSLVGPRPLSVRDYLLFSQDWHRRRFSVKPGITCLWQVNGRNSVGFERWMELDMEYIDRWSLWLDFKILVQTIPAVLRGSGAM